MSLADHLRVIATNWWRILIIAAVVGALTYFYSRSQPKSYDSATLLSVAGNPGNGNDINVTPDALLFRADYYAAIAKSSSAGAGAKAAHLNMTTAEASAHVSTLTNSASNGLILLKATGSTPLAAQRLASATAIALTDYVKNQQTGAQQTQELVLQGQLDSLNKRLRATPANTPVYAALTNSITSTQTALIQLQTQPQFAVVTVTPASLSTAPVAPKPSRDATLLFLVAAIVAAEALVIIRAFSDRFARTQDAALISEFTGMPVLAMIPRGRGPDVVEAFRTLRTNLLFLEGAGRPRTVAMVSPNPGAGKSFCAIHLAESAVAVDAEVVLVDADLRRPVIHSRVRVPREPGLSDALRGADLHSAIHCVEGIPNLKVMPSGSPVSDTVGVLGGRAFRGILDALDTAELVVVDTPPGAVYADALAVSAQCDATLLVLDAKTTRRRAARLMIDSLERTGATLIGVVVNNASFSRRDTYERG
ncbi:MAG: capsular exopolysaccharide biosynthesis protein [Actinomycetia bacterium]|nr:capsular exopolysaccharide biosynthesis protein [Actinomycetes bacterium]